MSCINKNNSEIMRLSKVVKSEFMLNKLLKSYENRNLPTNAEAIAFVNQITGVASTVKRLTNPVDKVENTIVEKPIAEDDTEYEVDNIPPIAPVTETETENSPVIENEILPNVDIEEEILPESETPLIDDVSDLNNENEETIDPSNIIQPASNTSDLTDKVVDENQVNDEIIIENNNAITLQKIETLESFEVEGEPSRSYTYKFDKNNSVIVENKEYAYSVFIPSYDDFIINNTKAVEELKKIGVNNAIDFANFLTLSKRVKNVKMTSLTPKSGMKSVKRMEDLVMKKTLLLTLTYDNGKKITIQVQAVPQPNMYVLSVNKSGDEFFIDNMVKDKTTEIIKEDVSDESNEEKYLESIVEKETFDKLKQTTLAVSDKIKELAEIAYNTLDPFLHPDHLNIDFLNIKSLYKPIADVSDKINSLRELFFKKLDNLNPKEEDYTNNTFYNNLSESAKKVRRLLDKYKYDGLIGNVDTAELFKALEEDGVGGIIDLLNSNDNESKELGRILLEKTYYDNDDVTYNEMLYVFDLLKREHLHYNERRNYWKNNDSTSYLIYGNEYDTVKNIILKLQNQFLEKTKSFKLLNTSEYENKIKNDELNIIDIIDFLKNKKEGSDELFSVFYNILRGSSIIAQNTAKTKNEILIENKEAEIRNLNNELYDLFYKGRYEYEAVIHEKGNVNKFILMDNVLGSHIKKQNDLKKDFNNNENYAESLNISTQELDLIEKQLIENNELNISCKL